VRSFRCDRCAFRPRFFSAALGDLIHAHLSGIARNLTLTSFVIGLVAWPVGTVLSFWFVAVLFNRLTDRPAAG